ncbi:MAG TPA: preprotein translocase subunit SecE [Candidatus Saccharimonadales bacterium]
MARALQQTTKQDDQADESLVRVFFRGFFLPVRLLWRGLAWIAHRPPLKQIGHTIRWFFRLRAVRFIGRILGLSFLRNSWRELKSVTWPARRDGLRLTWAVVAFSVVFAVIIAIVDYGLDKLFKQLLLK